MNPEAEQIPNLVEQIKAILMASSKNDAEEWANILAEHIAFVNQKLVSMNSTPVMLDK